jgi:hypothetical protein
MRETWRFCYEVDARLPPLSWLAAIDQSTRTVDVACGTSVVTSDDGFFEGTWVGDPGLRSLPASTTVFGSGVLVDEQGPLILTPSHTMSGVFTQHEPFVLLASNSLVALLKATRAELDSDVDYPSRLYKVLEGVNHSPIQLPTSRGTISYHHFWNLRTGSDGAATRVAKPEEEPFRNYAEYRSRLSAATASLFANAGGYSPCVSVSSGYDSTAVAVIAAENGCRRALTFRDGRKSKRTGDNIADSGEHTAARLGMDVRVFDRAAYLSRDDLPEAEFLATGLSAEDVVMSAYEECLPKSMLLTGTQGNGMWRNGGNRRTDHSRAALDGCSLQEFRLRVDFCFAPLPVFGLSQRPSVMDISASREMRPYRVGGYYDQPISRRIAEEGGIPRGTFAVTKQAVSALIHSEGESNLAPASAAAIRSFAAAEGVQVVYPRRKRAAFWERLVVRVGSKVGAKRLVNRIKGRWKRLNHFQPTIGTLLFRWGVTVVLPRYEALARERSSPKRSE